MIDNQVTAYSSKLHPNLLTKFQQDTQRGVGLLMNHNSRTLPVGRSFDAEMSYEANDSGDAMVSLNGKFYIDLGRNTQGGMTTDDLAKGIDAGTIFDTSIGFNAHSWECSICNNDIRDWRSCSHYPGEKYVVSRDGEDKAETCYVIVGKDGQGELLENSLVYAGACNRATITKSDFSANGVSDSDNGTKLHLVEDFKDIPLQATIYQYYTKDGSVLFTDTDDRTNGSQELRKRSEQEMELQKVLEVLGQFGVKAGTPEELTTALQAFSGVQEQLSAKEAELATKDQELSTANTKVTDLEAQLSQKDETISELTTANEQLTEKAGLAETYRQDLISATIEAGVRAQGNAFNAELFTKFLDTLSIDEIKGAKEGFENEVQEKFAGARFSAPNGTSIRRGSADPQSKEDFADEVEFRNFVADKAAEYAKEHNVNIGEATKLMMKKYSEKGSE
jgi:hypothetical protein